MCLHELLVNVFNLTSTYIYIYVFLAITNRCVILYFILFFNFLKNKEEDALKYTWTEKFSME